MEGSSIRLALLGAKQDFAIFKLKPDVLFGLDGGDGLVLWSVETLG
jgi:hypothetical protein